MSSTTNPKDFWACAATMFGVAAVTVGLVAFSPAQAQEIDPGFRTPIRKSDSTSPAGPAFGQPGTTEPSSDSPDDSAQPRPSYGIRSEEVIPSQPTSPADPGKSDLPAPAKGAAVPPLTRPEAMDGSVPIPSLEPDNSPGALIPPIDDQTPAPPAEKEYQNLLDRMAEPAPEKKGPVIEAPSLGDLRVELRDTLREREALVREEYIAGRAYLADLLAASDEVLYAELQLRESAAERLGLLQEYVDNLKKFEEKVVRFAESQQGRISQVDVLAVRAIRIRAQFGLTQEQSAGEPAPLAAG